MESTIAGIAFSFFGLIGIAGGSLNGQILMEPSHNYHVINALGPKRVRLFNGIL